MEEQRITNPISYPLLESQMGIYMACMAAKDSTAYNLPSMITFSKDIDTRRLVNAINKICAEKKELHTRIFHDSKGELRQWSDMEMPINVCLLVMSDEEANNHINNEFVRPFQIIGNQPLCRFEVVETPSRLLFLLDVHHIISDGITMSHNLVGQDLTNAYEGIPLIQSDEDMYKCAEKEKESQTTDAYQTDKDYFSSLFSDFSIVDIPTRHFQDSEANKTVIRSIEVAKIENWCEKHHTSENLLFMTTFSIMLAKISHSKQQVFTTLNHGRFDKHLLSAYGMFVNTIPIYINISNGMTVKDLSGMLRSQLTGAIRHRRYPFTHFCKDLGLSPRITFGFQGSDIKEQSILNGKVYPGEQLSKDIPRNELGCMVYMKKDRYELRIDSDGMKYGESDLTVFADCMIECMNNIMQNINQAIADIDIISETTKDRLLQLSRGEEHHIDYGKNVVVRIKESAEKHPNNQAVSDGIHSLTYSELASLVDNQCRWLKYKGVAKGEFVGIEAYPCIEFVASALAVMQAGCIYVPLDMEWPKERRNRILKDASINVIINPSERETFTSDKSSFTYDYNPEAPAYMIYTSGTSGSPKGVIVSHMALTNHTEFIVRRWRLDSNSKISCHSPLSFDASIEDIFPVLTVGGTLFIMPEELRRDANKICDFLETNHITGGCYTPDIGILISESRDLHLDYLCLGGERLNAIPKGHFHKYNTYGPTEFTVNATYYEIDEHTHSYNIPIGRPVDNCTAYLLDPFGKMVPQGFVGELCLCGPQLAIGYWNNPTLTSERFRYNKEVGRKIYHTGDFARWNEAGELEYMGRIDNQVKIDGHRIELYEIDQAIRSMNMVEDVRTILNKDGKRHFLSAYYTSPRHIDEQSLKKSLQCIMPSYMIPNRFIHIPKMPLGNNGKVDVQKLSLIELEKKSIKPRNSIEEKICGLYGSVLEEKEISADANFFDMGGTSLNAMELVVLAQKEGLEISYTDLYKYPTPESLSKHLSTNINSGTFDVSNYDYSKIHDYLQNDAIDVTKASSLKSGILLTGCTGFLGVHILKELLRKTDVEIYCVIRETSIASAIQHLQKIWNYYFENEICAIHENRMKIVLGDLCDRESIKNLSELEIDTIINCAADVNYLGENGNPSQVNIAGVENISDLCIESDLRLIHISTTSTLGIQSIGNSSTDLSKILYRGQTFFEAYSYSKFLGERIILEDSINQGLRATIVRVGYLSARSYDQKHQINPSANALIRIHNEMKDTLLTEVQEIEMIPVDKAAEDVVEIYVKGNNSHICYLPHSRKIHYHTVDFH